VPIESPCIKVCQLAADADLCLGCLRTSREIALWLTMTPEARRQVMAELPRRAAARRAAGR
jgi:predicted Fe-S protein YdhL (DUF1289 family)